MDRVSWTQLNRLLDEALDLLPEDRTWRPTVSIERLRQRGATITLRTLQEFDHSTSWIMAMPQAVRWFRAMD